MPQLKTATFDPDEAAPVEFLEPWLQDVESFLIRHMERDLDTKTKSTRATKNRERVSGMQWLMCLTKRFSVSLTKVYACSFRFGLSGVILLHGVPCPLPLSINRKTSTQNP